MSPDDDFETYAANLATFCEDYAQASAEWAEAYEADRRAGFPAHPAEAERNLLDAEGALREALRTPVPQ